MENHMPIDFPLPFHPFPPASRAWPTALEIVAWVAAAALFIGDSTRLFAAARDATASISRRPAPRIPADVAQWRYTCD
ncbi:hypothetical protein CKAH01_18453 [Colletotrichum kahawae]|uniref:Uncharacterized protein n=1 Tax=Colletotrichum kahawae TaxID=34407 RepID=A0AAD9Y612_COLKA|nr:hypothetical protein CKAH01_18453 [Colletotrichum kahawae]